MLTNEEPQTKWHLRGGNPPAVNPGDLKKVWRASADYEAHHPGENSISDTFYQSVGPGADVESAWYRVAMLLVLKEMMPELFESWTHGTELDDVVFQVAAAFPMGRASVARERDLPFDVDEFVKQVGARIKKPGASCRTTFRMILQIAHFC